MLHSFGLLNVFIVKWKIMSNVSSVSTASLRFFVGMIYQLNRFAVISCIWLCIPLYMSWTVALRLRVWLIVGWNTDFPTWGAPYILQLATYTEQDSRRTTPFIPVSEFRHNLTSTAFYASNRFRDEETNYLLMGGVEYNIETELVDCLTVTCLFSLFWANGEMKEDERRKRTNGVKRLWTGAFHSSAEPL